MFYNTEQTMKLKQLKEFNKYPKLIFNRMDQMQCVYQYSIKVCYNYINFIRRQLQLNKLSQL